jgi:hypothetical protein
MVYIIISKLIRYQDIVLRMRIFQNEANYWQRVDVARL